MKVYRSFALAGVGLAAIAMPAFAQNAAPPMSAQSGPPAPANADTGATADDTIIVQARRRDERLQDVPVVVNAVTAATLEKDNIHQFRDITQVVPGLSLVPNANGIGSSSSIRGVNHDVNVSGDNGTIQYYLNDAPISSDSVFQALYDVKSIDVERGPQGTLRGRAAPSGAIAITTRQPDLYEPGAYVDGTIGTHNTKNLQFGIGVPVIKDILAVRVAGIYDFNRGDRVTSINNPIQPSNDTRSLRASVRFDPVNWLTTGFSFTTLQHENIGYDQASSFSQVDSTVGSGLSNPNTSPLPFQPGSVASTPGNAVAPNYGTISPRQRLSVETRPRDGQQHFHRYDWHGQASFLGQNLIYVGSHESFGYDVKTDQDTGAYYPNLATYNQRSQTNSAVTTHEVRLQNAERLAGMFDYVVGYFRQTSAVSTVLSVPALVGLTTNATLAPGLIGTFPIPAAFVGGFNPFVVATAVSLPLSHTKEESFFGNLTVHFGDHNEISGGVRHIKYTDRGQDLFVNGALTSPATPNNGKPTIYNFTARHRFGENAMVYASTGSSWRPGGHAIGDFSQLFSSNEQNFTHTNAETSKNYEVGLKSTLLDKKVLFNITYYHQNFKDYPFRAAGNGIYYINYTTPTTPTVGQFNFISGVPVKVDGVETEIDFHPIHALSVEATVNYSKSRVGNAQIPCDLLPYNQVPNLAALQAVLPAGQHVGSCSGAGLAANFQPNWTGSVTAEYDVRLRGDIEGFVRGLATLRGASKNDPLNPYDNVGAYGLINGYVGIRNDKGGWSLMVYGKNLGNVTKILTLNGQPNSISETVVNTSNGQNSSATFVGRYGGLTVTSPREFGVNLRVAFGSH
jgi:iron complex outermembrane receptor protein